MLAIAQQNYGGLDTWHILKHDDLRMWMENFMWIVLASTVIPVAGWPQIPLIWWRGSQR
jgi:hypothetical protein